MATTGDLRVLGAFNALPSSTSRLFFLPSSVSSSTSPSKLLTSSFSLMSSNTFEKKLNPHNRPHKQYHCVGVSSNLPSITMNQDEDGFLHNAFKMNFLERLNLAWKILFPSTTAKKNSNARIAKQRLKMILFADRCAVSEEAKQKIVSSIIKALSDFVEIEPQDKVQLSVSTDIDLGTVYSVTIPVRRVKPGYQQSDEEYSGITGISLDHASGRKNNC
ncbi:hypothetical protein HPP92_017886 [Vanilla planifolia]|uniref:Plastid division regulator MinE n=1 Tax=Vanilla planifolia TaxID=51239 RepID=A0A835QGY9_VANPL|nr:hypothetical protein HPP92_017886 [Vanilla planifolia]